jgi:peptidoglycan/xylan/chitin deacetylase (PgdA/CDA1 family)
LPEDRFLVRGPSGNGGIALTFDDGPHPEITPRLLDALAQHQVRATFFLIGREAERFPALIGRMLREGHAVGHHSWTHSEPAETTAATLLAEVRRCQELLAAYGAGISDRFRPPKGQLTAVKLARLLGARQRVILWSADPKDYQLESEAPLLAWVNGAPLASGDIVLLHDTKPHCLAVLPALVERARALGQPLVSLDAWLPAVAVA